ncbi:MAG TPA: thiamine-phosphate kinase [Candidatus Aminicenantes bacterium]|nr:thiamine-phosphate kinase [Candidatus Aminicenantes bacterium]
MRLRYLGERRVVSHIRRAFGDRRRGVLVGIGDDAALVRTPGRLLLSTDLLVEDVDFRRDAHPPRLLGRKALNVNLSDIAAMGGRPLHAVAGLALPADIEESWLKAFLAGFRAAAREAGVALVGGDLSQAERIVVAVTVTGEARFPVLRSGARPGDAVFVSGTLGDAAGGLRLVEEGGHRGVVKAVRPLIEAFLDPAPRLGLGALVARRKLASAMIDLSDGLSVDLSHICEESGVGAEIEAERVPVSAALAHMARDPLSMAINGGEDFELLFTVRPRHVAAVERLAARHRLSRIGRITAGRRRVLIGPGKRRSDLRAKGFEHFTG